MDKRFLTILATLVVIFGGIFVMTQRSNENTSVKGTASVSPSNHVVGEGSQNVTLTEYGDFECAVCLAYEPTLQQVRTTYAKEVKFQYRHLPLVGVHKNAFASARAAEAASLQGKFWEMHDMLYNRTNWEGWTVSSNPNELFATYAKQIGLDENKFRADFASEQVNDIIQADLAEFKKTGQKQATPTFFLNGKYVANSQFSDENGRPQLEKFKQLIDKEITKQSNQ